MRPIRPESVTEPGWQTRAKMPITSREADHGTAALVMGAQYSRWATRRRRKADERPQGADLGERQRLVAHRPGVSVGVSAAQRTFSCTRPDSQLWNPGLSGNAITRSWGTAPDAVSKREHSPSQTAGGRSRGAPSHLEGHPHASGLVSESRRNGGFRMATICPPHVPPFALAQEARSKGSVLNREPTGPRCAWITSSPVRFTIVGAL